MNTNSFIDNMAPTSGRLILWLLAAGGIVAVGELPYLRPYHSETLAPFIGGLLVAAAIASWTLDAKERREEAAMKAFWGPFTEGVRIVLPSFEPKLAEVDELSPFTLYHDAIASYAVQTFLQTKYGAKAVVVSSQEIGDVSDIADQHLILIGGPNFNDITKSFMMELWAKYDGSFFHWSSTINEDASLRQLLQRKGDHLVKVESCGDSEPLVGDVIFDVCSGNRKHPSNARGMCIRAEGVFGEDKTVLVLAGVDTAFGTLAAANYVLDASNLTNIASGAATQVIVGANVHGYTISRSCGLRQLRVPELVPKNIAPRV